MMEAFKGWITTICTIMIFIYCIELLMPNNSLRKYAKFTTGLILVVVIINPFLTFVNGEFSFDSYISKAEEYLDSECSTFDYEKYKNENIKKTVDSFSENLQIVYKKKLESIYCDDTFTLEIKCQYDEKEGMVSVVSADIYMQQKSIVNIKNVNIGEVFNEEVEAKHSPKVKEIKNLLCNELDIDSKGINIY